MDWGSFWTVVAGPVVAGIILLAIGGTWRWYTHRRKRKAKEAEVKYTLRSTIRVGGHIVAKELRANAEVMKRIEEGDEPPSQWKMQTLLFEWRGRRNEIAGLRDENPELWRELETAYGDLDHARHGLVKPPGSDDLLKLADRLDEAAERE